MNDCQDVAVREALPELARGTLAEPARTRTQQHVDGCMDCADELAIIRSVLAVAERRTPPVDVAQIAAAIPAYVPAVAVHRFAHLRLAAALLVGAIGISAVGVQMQRSWQPAPTASVARVHAAPSPQVGVALVGTADLSDDNLAQLISSMDDIEAVPPAEPEPLTPVPFEGGTS